MDSSDRQNQGFRENYATQHSRPSIDAARSNRSHLDSPCQPLRPRRLLDEDSSDSDQSEFEARGSRNPTLDTDEAKVPYNLLAWESTRKIDHQALRQHHWAQLQGLAAYSYVLCRSKDDFSPDAVAKMKQVDSVFRNIGVELDPEDTTPQLRCWLRDKEQQAKQGNAESSLGRRAYSSLPLRPKRPSEEPTMLLRHSTTPQACRPPRHVDEMRQTQLPTPSTNMPRSYGDLNVTGGNVLQGDMNLHVNETRNIHVIRDPRSSLQVLAASLVGGALAGAAGGAGYAAAAPYFKANEYPDTSRSRNASETDPDPYENGGMQPLGVGQGKTVGKPGRATRAPWSPATSARSYGFTPAGLPDRGVCYGGDPNFKTDDGTSTQSLRYRHPSNKKEEIKGTSAAWVLIIRLGPVKSTGEQQNPAEELRSMCACVIVRSIDIALDHLRGQRRRPSAIPINQSQLSIINSRLAYSGLQRRFAEALIKFTRKGGITVYTCCDMEDPDNGSIQELNRLFSWSIL